MDIEGSEYKVIPDFLSQEIKPNQLLIEFHYYRDSSFIKLTEEIVNNWLYLFGYRVFYISHSCREVCLIRL